MSLILILNHIHRSFQHSPLSLSVPSHSNSQKCGSHHLIFISLIPVYNFFVISELLIHTSLRNNFTNYRVQWFCVVPFAFSLSSHSFSKLVMSVSTLTPAPWNRIIFFSHSLHSILVYPNLLNDFLNLLH